jgi:hypothetical protein
MRRKLAISCVPAFLGGIGVLAGILLFLFSIPVWSQGDWSVFFALLIIIVVAVLSAGLPALVGAMTLLFVGGRHVLAHPITFALMAAGMGPLPLLFFWPPSPSELGAVLMSFPGVFVAFVILASRIDRMAREL